MDIPAKHQKNIAYKTLRMTPAMARIMGGMTWEEAYKIIFRMDIRERLAELEAEYKQADGTYEEGFCWELGKYGWDNPSDLSKALG